MATWAIIPVKQLSEAKSSLKPALTHEQRREFVLRMLEDVLAAVELAQSVDNVMIVSPDDEVLNFANSKGATTVIDPGAGLNDALRTAIDRAEKSGAEEVLILPADIPLLRPADIEEIINKPSGERGIVIAPSEEDGTNALLLRPPDVMDIHFGGESFPKHMKEARRRGIHPHIYRSKGLEVDVDDVTDFIKLEARGLGTRTHDFLERLK